MKPPYCQANSLTVDEAADLMRISAERLAAGKAGARAYRVAAAVWTLTVPFAKGWDAIFVDELGKHANMVDSRAVRRAIKECVALGALEWEPNRWIPPKGQPGRPSLIGLPGAPKRGSNRPHLTDAKRGSNRPYNLSVEVMSVELNTHNSSIDTDERHSSLIGASDRSSADWEAERHAGPQAKPAPDALAGMTDGILAEIDAPTVAERFPPYHADERTGDGVGDGEREQMRWEADNPAKARARRQT